MLKKLLQNQLVRYVLVLLIGVGIGAVFYPTSHIEEKLKEKHSEELLSIKNSYEKTISEISEKLDKTSEIHSSYRQESEKRINSLTTQVHTLQSKQKTSFYKLIKPDGTIEVKKFSESEVNESNVVIAQIQEEFKTKIDSIEQKWETIHKERIEFIKKDFVKKEEMYQKKIDELEKSRIVTKNKKSFGIEGGYNTEQQFYIHGIGDLYGPLFMGIHTESNKELDNKSIGIGLGIKF